MHSAPIGGSLNVIVLGSSAFPNDLILEKLRTKNRVHQQLQVVASCWVAMEVDGAGFFEDSAQFDEAWCHHGEVGEHVGAAEEGAEGAHGVGDSAARLDDLYVS